MRPGHPMALLLPLVLGPGRWRSCTLGTRFDLPAARVVLGPAPRARAAANLPWGNPGGAPSFPDRASGLSTARAPAAAPAVQQFGPRGGAGLVQVAQRLGAAFHGPRLTAPRAIPHAVAGDGKPQRAHVRAACFGRRRHQQPAELIQRLHRPHKAEGARAYALL